MGAFFHGCTSSELEILPSFSCRFQKMESFKMIQTIQLTNNGWVRAVEAIFSEDEGGQRTAMEG